jgi:hypothetical protein
MTHLRKLALGLATSALLATSVTPAFARGGGGWGGGGYGWGNSWGGGHGRHHRRGDDDTAEVLGGVLLGAILVGVIGSASKKSKQARRTSDEDYPQRDARYPDNNRPNDSRSEDSRYGGRITSEDQAVDACATAAEAREGRSSSVRDITRVRSSSDGWDVEGVIENRDNWRDKSATRHNFTCSVRSGSVETVYVEGRSVAALDDQDEVQAN